MSGLIYVHIDVTSNAVLSKGINHRDVIHSITHQPENLLLLNPSTEDGEYDVHTGMKVIKGVEKVQKYFSRAHRQKANDPIKWMDFSDGAMLKELTPLEISELLYFGHMKNSLHSPFFYKLQNNFVFFEFIDQTTRVYYRYIDEFYRVLANKISQVLEEKVNGPKVFFKKGLSIEKMDSELLKDMKAILQEGVVFCFNHIKMEETEYQIPIYMIEDSLWKVKNYRYQGEPTIAKLIYNKNSCTWRFEKDSNYLQLSQTKKD